MISPEKLAQVFEGMLGWPYASPGSNNAQGIDCSGAFVYAYRQFGQSIYHGSNRIIRKYCHGVFAVSGTKGLRVGMAIFKGRSDLSRMKAEYKPGGRYYDPALPLDYYHMGLVTSVNPLKIVNATPPRVRVDSDPAKWCCAAYLNAVDDTAAPPAGIGAEVTAPSGGTVNLRGAPSKSAVVRVRVPIGARVDVIERTDDTWWRVRYQKTTGYMMREFLR